MSTTLSKMALNVDLLWEFKDAKKQRLGKLSIDNNRMTLEFKTTHRNSRSLPHRDSELHAKVGDHFRVTMYDPWQYSSQMSGLNNTVTTQYQGTMVISQMLSGRKLKKSLNNIAGELPMLNIWLGVDKSEYDYSARVLRDSEATQRSIDCADWALTLRTSVDIERADQTLIARNKNEAVIHFKHEVSYWTAISTFRIVEDFINFIFTVPHYEQTFINNVFSKDGLKVEAVRELNQQYGEKTKREYKSVHRVNLLFKYADLSNTEAVLQNWAKQHDSLKPIIENLVFVKSLPLTPETRFLTYINCLEILHSKFYDRPRYDATNYSEASSRILSDIEDQDAELVKNLLEHGNHLSLLARLKDVRDMAVSAGCRPLTNKQLNRAKNTRNKMIHDTPGTPSELVGPVEMLDIERTFGQYVKCLVLRIIGVSEEDLKKITESSMQFSYPYSDGVN